MRLATIGRNLKRPSPPMMPRFESRPLMMRTRSSTAIWSQSCLSRSRPMQQSTSNKIKASSQAQAPATASGWQRSKRPAIWWRSSSSKPESRRISGDQGGAVQPQTADQRSGRRRRSIICRRVKTKRALASRNRSEAEATEKTGSIRRNYRKSSRQTGIQAEPAPAGRGQQRVPTRKPKTAAAERDDQDAKTPELSTA